MSIIDEINAIIYQNQTHTVEDTWEILRKRVTVLSERVWEGRNKWPEVEAWLDNFTGKSGIAIDTERLHALFLLSQFLYIGSKETRVLLRALYIELYYIPLVQEVRTSLGGTRDVGLVESHLNVALSRTRFLGVGNPSESGVHLLYYFRQENRLKKELFLDSADMFQLNTLADGSFSRAVSPDVDRYVFVDDVCGSGETALKYSTNILTELIQLKKHVKLYYFSLFATDAGMGVVRNQTAFGKNSGAIFELDETYKCLEDSSRIMRAAPPHIDKATAQTVAKAYGHILCPFNPNGFDNNQLLLGFHHNTPDNTLPIIWWEGTAAEPWTPAFKRYPKI